MLPTPRRHAAPLGLAGVLFGFVRYKHVAPSKLAASAAPEQKPNRVLSTNPTPS